MVIHVFLSVDRLASLGLRREDAIVRRIRDNVEYVLSTSLGSRARKAPTRKRSLTVSGMYARASLKQVSYRA